MLSSVLNSDRAIIVNIKIIRVFTRLRTILESHREILQIIERLQKKDTEHDKKILLIFEFLNKLEHNQQKERNLDNENGSVSNQTKIISHWKQHGYFLHILKVLITKPLSEQLLLIPGDIVVKDNDNNKQNCRCKGDGQADHSCINKNRPQVNGMTNY